MIVQRQHDHSFLGGPSKQIIPSWALNLERPSPCWVLLLGLRFTLLCCRTPKAAAAANPQHGTGIILCRKMDLWGERLPEDQKDAEANTLKKHGSFSPRSANRPRTTPLHPTTETTSHFVQLQSAQIGYMPPPGVMLPPPREQSSIVPPQPATSHKDPAQHHQIWSLAITETLSLYT